MNKMKHFKKTINLAKEKNSSSILIDIGDKKDTNSDKKRYHIEFNKIANYIALKNKNVTFEIHGKMNLNRDIEVEVIKENVHIEVKPNCKAITETRIIIKEGAHHNTKYHNSLEYKPVVPAVGWVDSKSLKMSQGVKLMIKVAKLYYENNLKQESVARRLNISKYKVNRLLKRALSEGIVSINITKPKKMF